MILGLILLGLLATLVNKWDKPFLSALIYSSLKLAVAATMVFLIHETGNDPVAPAFGLAFAFAIYLGLSWLIAWLFNKYRGKTWSLVVCTLLAVPLLFV